MAKSKNSTKKIFVLDTSVILHDHNSINNFEEHDVAIPITVLEELDNFKIGNETKNFACREFIRTLDALSENQSLVNWVVNQEETIKLLDNNLSKVAHESSDKIN